jgi:hypothetical protein
MRISTMLAALIVSAGLSALPVSVAIASTAPAHGPQNPDPGPGHDHGGFRSPIPGYNRDYVNGVDPHVYDPIDPGDPAHQCPQYASDGSIFNPCGF